MTRGIIQGSSATFFCEYSCACVVLGLAEFVLPNRNVGPLRKYELFKQIDTDQESVNDLAVCGYVEALLAAVKNRSHFRHRGIQSALQVNHPAKHQDDAKNLQHPRDQKEIAMNAVATRLMLDESGFIVSAELILIGTIGVLALVVGLSEVALNINNELEDVASAFGSVNQSFQFSGTTGHGGRGNGSGFRDHADFCSGSNITSTPGTGEQ